MAKKIAIASKIGVSVKGVFEDFVVAQTAKGYTEKTIANYRSHFKSISRHIDIDRDFANILKEIIGKAASATPWIIENCYFISEDKKGMLSAYLAIQYIRIKQVRNRIIDSADCLVQALKDMGASDEVIGKYAISKNDSKNIQAQMLMDLKSLSDLAISFLSLTWILCINQTKKKLYTSDSPIGTHAHVDHPIMSMNGLKSKGVEVFFPISPECILVMFDGSYHFQNAHLERKYVLLDNEA